MSDEPTDEEKKLLESTPERPGPLDKYKRYLSIQTTKHPIDRRKLKSRPERFNGETAFIPTIDYRGTRIWVGDAAYYLKDHGNNVREFAKLEAVRVLNSPENSPVMKRMVQKCQDIDHRRKLAEHAKSLRILKSTGKR